MVGKRIKEFSKIIFIFTLIFLICCDGKDTKDKEQRPYENVLYDNIIDNIYNNVYNNINNNIKAVQVDAGEEFTCALLDTKEVKCWGDNSSGQLGDGTICEGSSVGYTGENCQKPMPVDVVGLSSGISKISAGVSHTCALLDTGKVECWGSGPLGDGSTIDSSVPVEVIGITGAIDISSGGGHTCVVLSTGGVKCWGYNDSGQVGDGTYCSYMDCPNFSDLYKITPVDVVGLSSGAVAISAGGSHTCALLSSGKVKCWGDGTTTPVEVSNLSDVKAISAGGYHTCALISSGGIKCWGRNFWGELGNGSININCEVFYDDPRCWSIIPVDVMELTSGVIDISVGGFDWESAHSCALLSTGEIKCWGDNWDGQLGDGSTNDSGIPVNVIGITDAIDITVGDFHTCAVLSTGEIKCWGDNSSGQLGDGSTTDSTVPVNVIGIGP